MNRLSQLKEILDKVAQHNQRTHIEINYDGAKFFWGITLGSPSAFQLDSLLNATDDPVPDSLGPHRDSPDVGARCPHPSDRKEPHA
jgi:hypothetical protein